MTIPVTAALAAVLGLLLVALATRISVLRVRLKISFGDGGNPQMLRAIRVHGNTVEHAPIFILLALAYELTAGTDDLLIVTGAAFVLARLAYTAGVIGRGLHLLRMGGALFTYLLQAVLAAGVLVALLTGAGR